jgi:hypothetical protein
MKPATPMKSTRMARACCTVLATCAGAGGCLAQPTLGIPEPGLVLFGSVTNAVGLPPFPIEAVTWQISGGNPVALATVQAMVVAVNGQFFYVARVPFETRPAGAASLGPTPNLLGLTRDRATYARAVRVNGTNAVIVASSRGTLVTFPFGAADRGLIERVDLLLDLPGKPAPDTDGDGVPDWAEVMAGTDPTDPKSVLKMLPEVRPAMGGGLSIGWASVAGKAYAVVRTTDLGQPFTLLTNGLPASSSQTQYTDATATGPGPYFYRVQVE